MFKYRKKLDNNKEPLQLHFYEDGRIFIPKDKEMLIISSIKRSRIKEIELLNYSIKNLASQISITKKMIDDNINNFEISKRDYITKLKKDINPDLLCPICFDNRLDTILTPCGHTFCKQCIGLSNDCYICRTNVKQSYSVFI